MKKAKRKFLALLLVLSVLMSLCPVSAFAADEPMQIIASCQKGAAGSTVVVDISLANNPGITSMKLNVQFGDILQLESVTYNAAFGGFLTDPETMDNPVTLTWVNAFETCYLNDTFATLTFTLDENATANQVADIIITYDPEDIYDMSETNVPTEVQNGSVTVVETLPGDINGDQAVNNKDVTRLCQFLANWDVEVNESTLDTNNDGSINNKDLTRLLQYLANWDVEIYCGETVSKKCNHTFVKTEGVLPTCQQEGNIEYWTCTKCGEIYKDSVGLEKISIEETVLKKTNHTIVILPYVAPTYESTGLTEGKYCSVCGEVIVAQEEIPMLEKEQYAITYHVDNNDTYLQSIHVENTNPTTYTSEDGLRFSNLIVDGYIFEGWYDSAGSNGALVKEIPKGSTGSYDLYAKWSKVEYDIIYKTYLTPLKPIEDETYTTEKGKMDLVNPELDNYVFLGWYDKDGTQVISIPVGSTGDVVLQAYWTSKRNLTKKVNSLEEPIVAEDRDNNVLYFTYEIGSIENVPLKENWSVNSVAGLEQELSKTVKFSMSNEEAEEIGKTILESTTGSDTWTLSAEWNKSTSVNEEWAKENGLTVEEAEQTIKSSSGTYAFTSSSGGSSYDCSSDNTTTKQYNDSDVTHTDNSYLDASVAAEVGTNKLSPVQAKVSTELSTGISNENVNNQKSGTSSETINTNVSEKTSSFNKSSASTSTNEQSRTNSINKAISETISKTKGYGETYSEGGANSSSKELELSNAEENKYSNYTVFSTSEVTEETKTYKMDGKIEGCYRSVIAGTVHVFATVKYDINTNAYTVATMGIMDDKTYEWLDYSPSMNFDDNENGVIPFEIPYFVNEYVSEKIALTDGLEFRTNSLNGTATITKYAGDSTEVNIPSYISDGTNAYKVIALEDNLFENQPITKVKVGQYVEKIPNSAFKNCINLEEVSGYFTKIGNAAFSGCVKLNNFAIGNTINEIGENAFFNVPEITAEAKTKEIAINIINSGARNIILDISNINDTENLDLYIPNMDTFELKGDSKTRTELSNFKLNSDAKITKLSKLIINNSTGIPVQTSSNELVLDTVTITSSSYGMLLLNDTNIELIRDNFIISNSNKAIVSRNINLQSATISNINGYLDVTGNIYYCGDIQGDTDQLYINPASKINISEAEFEKYIKGSFIVTFNPVEGILADGITSKEMYCGEVFGTLPTPTKDYYTFDGWYTSVSDGNKVTSDTTVTESDDMTIYAHWIQNPISDWVQVTNVPDEAQITNHKWSYTLTSYTTAGNSSMDGWTKYDENYVWGDWSGWSQSNPADSGDREEQSRYIDPVYKTQYHYYNWCTSKSDMWTTQYAANNNSYGGSAKLNELWSDTKLDYHKTLSGIKIYKGPTGENYNNPYWIYADGTAGGLDTPTRKVVASEGYTEYSYRDKIWTYYFTKTENKELNECPSGDNISNVVEWVQYRAK